MFDEIVQRSAATVAAAAAAAAAAADEPAIEGSPSVTRRYEVAAKLLQLLVDESTSSAALLSFLNDQVVPLVGGVERLAPRFLGWNIDEALERLVLRKKNAPLSPTEPTVGAILQVRERLGSSMGDVWESLTSPILHHLCTFKTSSEDYPSFEAYETVLARVEDLSLELIEAWKLLSNHLGPVDVSQTGVKLPVRWRFHEHLHSLAQHAKTRRHDLALKSIFPRWPTTKFKGLPAAILASSAVFMDESRVGLKAREQAAPFLRAVRRVLLVSGMGQSQVAIIMKTNPALSAYVLARWPEFIAQMHRGPGSRHGADADSAKLHRRASSAVSSTNWTPEPSSKASKQRTHELQRRLRDAFHPRRPNIGEIDYVWAEFTGQYAKSPMPAGSSSSSLRAGVELFDEFLRGYMAAGLTREALAVLAFMESLGVPPTVKSWTVMMDGCKQGKNAAGIQAIWNGLVSTGAPLDAHVWTARVDALAHCGLVDQSIAALEEMATLWRKWESSPSERPPHVVEPTIAPVNALIARLLPSGGLAAAGKVLGWAESAGISPDAATFNTLLGHVLRAAQGSRDLGAEVQTIFAQMTAQGVDPDEYTFTLILGTISRGRSGKERAEAVREVLALMEESGLAANAHTYSKIFHLLLDSSPQSTRPGGNHGAGDAEAAKAVLEHMWRRGVPPSSHLLTIMADHYLSRSPPDVAAVRAMVATHGLAVSLPPPPSRAGPGGVVRGAPMTAAVAAMAASTVSPDGSSVRTADHVFWCRLVEGFARGGSVDEALDVMRRLRDAGQPVLLKALHPLLRAVVERRDHHQHQPRLDGVALGEGDDDEPQWLAEAREVVDVAMSGAEGRTSPARHYKHAFWHAAVDYGLLDAGKLRRLQEAEPTRGVEANDGAQPRQGIQGN